jgi:glycerol uptake facilitator-like aquaporin
MFEKNKVATMLAEFFGTGILTLVVLSVQRSTIGIPYFVAIAAGLAVVAMLLALGKVSGAHLNPALTIGMWTARKISTLRAIVYIVAQLLGAWAAFGLYQYFVNQKITIIGSHFEARILVSEIIGAFIFALAWGAATYRNLDGGVFASTAGIAFTLGMLVAATAGVGLINPALALGTRAWVPWQTGVTGWGTYLLGPIVGAIAGINVYGLFMTPEGFSFMKMKTTSSGASVAVASVKATAKKPASKAKSTRAKSSTKRATTRRK